MPKARPLNSQRVLHLGMNWCGRWTGECPLESRASGWPGGAQAAVTLRPQGMNRLWDVPPGGKGLLNDRNP